MDILPAIDLKEGRCVRLRQGRAEETTVYFEDPVEAALKWQSLGAVMLHVVDLTGAFNGRPFHTEVFRRIAGDVGIPFEVGGGLRTDADVEEVLEAGASRVILGTRAVSDMEAVRALAAAFHEKIAVGIDARGGFVQVNGWVETTTVPAVTLAKKVRDAGVRTIIYTDTATDGMLSGLNLKALAEIADAVPEVSVIASGGVRTSSDVAGLRNLRRKNISGVIIGKALYEGTANLSECMAEAAL